MDNYAFEMLIADVWEGFGYDTTVSQESNDKGLDVMAIHRETGERVAIQAKCYAGSNRIGRPAVQQYSSLYQQENADRVYIVSTGYYTDTAIESGRELGVGLITGIDLCREIADLEHGDDYTVLSQSECSKPSTLGKDPRSKSFTLRVVVALLGGIYLLGGYGAIAAATSIPMISQLHPLFAFFSMGTNPGFGLIFLSVLAIGFVLLKWASLWRWKVAGVLIPASWFAVAMAGTMESNPAFWIQATILSVAFLSPIIVPAMFSFRAHHWILRGLRAVYHRVYLQPRC
ncbi:restriction endonuclease [Haloplanus sp. GCM10025708]|uniref:restriction endonuclease n=1 Tax=Haloplanus sp. GCM10025708 TaxID=3252679 RepID=UPI0036085641